jgi:hypothetical protein
VGGTKRILIKWRSTNPERRVLTASIDYSADGGRHWRTIWIGGDTGHVSLPSFYFPQSTDAMVRVRVNDGFNETPATSARFTALAPPPQVSILAPDIKTEIAGDAAVQLTGSAWDAQQQELGGTSLRWYDGRTPLGTGSSLLAGPLPPGVNTIRLIANAPGGTTAAATATIDVYNVSPPFLNLQIPPGVSSNRDALTITATSTLVGTLSAGGQSLQLEPKLTARVTVPVVPGATPLILHFVIDAGGVRIPFARRVIR